MELTPEQIWKIRDLLSHADFAFVLQGIELAESLIQNESDFLVLLKAIGRKESPSWFDFSYASVQSMFEGFEHEIYLGLWGTGVLAQWNETAVNENTYIYSEEGLTSLPDSMKHLVKLESLEMNYNELTILPDCIENLAQLTNLEVRYNPLANLPKEIPSLSIDPHLWNRFRDQICHMTTLKCLSIYDEDEDSIMEMPQSFGNLRGLTEFYLTGKTENNIPPSLSLIEVIGKLTSLSVLSITSNQLTSLSKSIGNLKELTDLGLNFNASLTNIDDAIGNLNSLTTLDLSENNITSMPESIGDLTCLTTLNLSENQITSLPESVGNLRQLSELDLTNNQLTRLPESIVYLSNLEAIKLMGNPIEHVPTGMTSLHLDRGQYRQLQDQICTMSSLIDLYICGYHDTCFDENDPIITLPKSIGNLTNLMRLELVLDENILTSLPESIGDLINLHTLSLSRSQLTSLPESIGNLRQLRKLSLFYNQLTSLPESIANLTCLTWLDLKWNKMRQDERDRIQALLPNCEIRF